MLLSFVLQILFFAPHAFSKTDYFTCRNDYRSGCYPTPWAQVVAERMNCLVERDVLAVDCYEVVGRLGKYPCFQYLKKYCQGAGSKSVYNCLKGFRKSLVPECQQEIDAHLTVVSKLTESCNFEVVGACTPVEYSKKACAQFLAKATLPDTCPAVLNEVGIKYP